jgi:hypothetical protein
MQRYTTRLSILSMVLGIMLILAACSQATSTPAPTIAPTNPPAPTTAPATKAPAPTTAPTVAPTNPPAPTTVAGVPAADLEQLLDEKFNKVDRKLALWNIQPGLGTVMIEYGNRLARLWYAANADNWDMAKYQLDEMTEIQEVGEITRPGRAEMLKAFEDGYLKPIDDAILAKDKVAFTKAFNTAIDGCNGCHKASTGGTWGSYKWVFVQPPQADPATYVNWAGQAQGSYIANPPPAATAVPTAPLTATLDAAGAVQFVDAKFNKVDRSLALWNIQPGLGTVMIEYGNRWSRLWFSSNAGNWDMAQYQLDEMIEIQEVGETTRPNRAQMLKAFEDGYLTAVDKAIKAQDKDAFVKAYNEAIDGCNGCHKASKSANWGSYQYVEIQVPTSDNNDYLVWNADKGTGNYIENPPAAPTATPAPAPSGVLDLTGLGQLIDGKFNAVDRSLALWNIQPGLGTVMIEYGNRLARLTYAAQAGNWDMAKYQLDEMTEIQEVGEITRPGRAQMLKAFEDGYLKPLDETILAQDPAAFTTALNDTVQGCNGCHGGSKSANWSSYAYVQIQLPQSDPVSYLKWDAPEKTGSYITPTPTP